MNVIAHALLPVVLSAPLANRFFPDSRARSLMIIGFAGALPDLLRPHLSLAARYHSWSHSLFAVGGFALLVAAISVKWRALLPPGLAVASALAYGLHIGADTISGGVAWLYPASPEVLGTRTIPFQYWFLIDAVLGLAAVAACTSSRPTRKVHPKISDS